MQTTDYGEGAAMLVLLFRLKALHVDAIGHDLESLRRITVTDVVVTTRLRVGDDFVREAGEQAIQPKAKFSEDAPGSGIGLRVADAPDDLREAAEGLQEERHEVRLMQVAVDDVRV